MKIFAKETVWGRGGRGRRTVMGGSRGGGRGRGKAKNVRRQARLGYEEEREIREGKQLRKRKWRGRNRREG